ncbi:hypothetical protein TCON_1070 [Astathelohania contejeani]|uniref:Uncharacterized protein n=1 Tax=Astathelohania contejeani TaxID=164912 RepID=A0ABQ7HZX3_9MICR|nr:hypothetical protein TCON_1070 [Thelohania contejeani]
MNSFIYICCFLLRVTFSSITKKNIQKLDLFLKNSNKIYTFTDEKEKIEKMFDRLKYPKKHDYIDFCEKDKTWILQIIDVICTAKNDPSSNEIFKFLSHQLYWLTLSNDIEFLKKLNIKFINMFNKFIIINKKIRDIKLLEFNDINEDTVLKIQKGIMKQFNMNLDKYDDIFFYQYKLLILIPVYGFTSSINSKLAEFLEPCLLEKYLIHLIASGLNDSILLLVVHSIVSSINFDIKFKCDNKYSLDNNLIYNVIIAITKENKTKNILDIPKTLFMIKENITIKDCVYIKDVVIFYLDHPLLKPQIRYYLSKNEDQLFELLMSLFINNCKIADEYDSRYKLLECLCNKQIDFSILNLFNHYFIFISENLYYLSTSFNILSTQKTISNDIRHIYKLLNILFLIITNQKPLQCLKISKPISELTSMYINTDAGIFSKQSTNLNNIIELFVISSKNNLSTLDIKMTYLFLISISFSKNNLLRNMNSAMVNYKENKVISDCISQIILIIFILRNKIMESGLFIFDEINAFDEEYIESIKNYNFNTFNEQLKDITDICFGNCNINKVTKNVITIENYIAYCKPKIIQKIKTILI